MNAVGPTDVPRMTMVARIIWMAQCSGLVVFAFVASLFMNDHTEARMATVLMAVALGATVILVPVGLFIRGESYKKHWRENWVEPPGYLKGNLVAWACCELPALVGIVACWFGGGWWPYGLGALLPFALLLVLWPDGRAMRQW